MEVEVEGKAAPEPEDIRQLGILKIFRTIIAIVEQYFLIYSGIVVCKSR